MMRKRLKIFLGVLLVLMAMLPSASHAQPDFKKCFDILAKNRVIYNQYNDSIFLIKEHGSWVNFFRRRALRNQQIFAANKEAINTILGYFKQNENVKPETYDSLYKAVRAYMESKRSDPFLAREFISILDKYYQSGNIPDSLDYSNYVNLWLGVVYVKFSQLGNDTTYLRKAASYFKRNLQESARRINDSHVGLLYALQNLTNTIFLRYNIVTLEEYRYYVRWLRRLVEEDEYKDVLKPDTERSRILAHLNGIDASVIRNVYLTDAVAMDKHFADSLMTVIVESYSDAKKLSNLMHIRLQVMQAKLNRITYKEALGNSLTRYEATWKSIKDKRLQPKEFTQYLQPFFTFFYINDMADIPLSRKKKIVKRMCGDIELAFQHRDDNQVWTDYVRNLNLLTTYERITKYLTPEERIRFLNSLNVATQVTTYAHSVHVSMIAETLMQGILEYEPTLLLNTMGYKFVEDIKRDKKQLLEFIHDAAMYHDLGKNSIISVVNNDYRPLTDEEFAIIKRHPELGLQYLELAPSLEKFHDTTLGHHKWYNGKGGYPDSFDNTKSPMRTMIDIITLSDCMQAATERVGRNYKGEKTFDTVMAEFRRDAGTRYNPQLVEFIDKHPDVAKKLADLINDGWVEIYYNIYSQFMK